MFKKAYLLFLLSVLCSFAKAQCPQLFDSNGNLSSNPYWIDCNGTSYTLNLQGGSNWGAYTINWGDGTSNTIGAAYTSPSIIAHTYTATTDTFIVILTTGTCTINGVVVMEKPVNAGIQIPPGGSLASCAPKTLQFINASTNVSKTTRFIWNYGDGTSQPVLSYTNAGTTNNHLYAPGTVNCQTAVTLSAYNYCTYNSMTTVSYSPIKVFDKDLAQITCSVTSRCFPDNYFEFNNTTVRNCVSFGNTSPRFEKWNFGNYWGMGQDSIINWKPWPPTFPVGVSFPGVGTYTISLQDSSLCGIATTSMVVNVILKPNSLITTSTNSVCQGLPITFTNSSTTGQGYDWNFDIGNGFQTLPYGNETQTYYTAGNYTVSLITYIPGSNGFCSDTSKKIISIKPQPTANFTFAPVYGCNNSAVTFNDLSIGSITNWNWNFGNGNTSTSGTPSGQNYSTVGQYPVSLIVRSSDGCRDTIQQNFNVYPAPLANFNVLTTCTGYNTTFNNTSTYSASDTITSYDWNFGDSSPNNNIASPTHIYSSAGTYTVTLNVTTAHCASTKTVVLIVNQKPTANYVANNYTVCPSTIISFSNTSLNANTYNWFLATGNTSVTTNAGDTYINTSQNVLYYNVMLIANTALGCKDTSIQQMVVNPKPQAQFTTTYTPKCAPVNITFNNTTIGGSSYYWSFGDGTYSSFIDTVHAYPNTTTIIKTVSVSLVATNSYGCKDSTLSSFIIYPEPIFNFTPINVIGCAPKSVTLTTVSGGVNYLWDFDDGSLFSGSNIQTHIFLNPTAVNDTFNVKLITTNAFNCKDTAWGQVIVKPSPTSSFGSNVSAGCANLTVNFSNSSTGQLTNQWHFGDGTTSSAVIPNHTYTNTSLTATNFPVSLVVLSVNGCKDSTSSSITVYPKANYTYTITQDTGCSVFNVPFNTTPGAVSYLWNFGDGVTQTAFNPTHGYTSTNPSGTTFTVSMTATSPYSCQNTQTTTVFAYPKPTAAFSMLNNIGCAPLITSFNNTSIGAITYNWYFGDASLNSSAVSPTHTYQNMGSIAQNYFVSLVAKDANGCKDSITSIINAYPEANYNYQILPDSGCSPLKVSFPTSAGATSYLWNFGDGQLGSGLNQNHTYVNSTSATVIFTVSLVATNAYGCKDTIKGQVKVFSVPTVNFTAGPILQTYPNATVTFNNTSSTGFGYNWTLGDGTTLTTYSIAPHTYTTWGVYPIKLIVSNARCRDSLVQNITIKPPLPIADFNGNKKGCQPLPVSFLNQSIYATNYVWNFGDGNTLSTPNPTHIYNTPGTYTVTLMAFGPGGSDTIKKIDSVTVYQKPFAYFTATPLLVYVPNDPVFFTNQSQNAVSYFWTFGDGGSSTNTSPTYKYILSGEYPVTLIATSLDGCVDTFKLESTIKAQAVTGVEIPNAFTPNPNGSSNGGVFDPTALNNDIFHPNLKGIVDFEMQIFNKWGETLFSTNDQNVGWDGYYKEKLCPEDVYIYKIRALTEDSKVIQKAGDVLLIR